MTQMLEHRGYLGTVEYSAEDEVLHGRLAFVRDLVTYEAEDAKGLKAAFVDAVDAYLADCAAEGREPEVPLKGSFNVRPGPELHRRAMVYAAEHGTTLNGVVSQALEAFLARK